MEISWSRKYCHSQRGICGPLVSPGVFAFSAPAVHRLHDGCRTFSLFFFFCHTLKEIDVWFQDGRLRNSNQYLRENHTGLINTVGWPKHGVQYGQWNSIIAENIEVECTWEAGYYFYYYKQGNSCAWLALPLKRHCTLRTIWGPIM